MNSSFMDLIRSMVGLFLSPQGCNDYSLYPGDNMSSVVVVKMHLKIVMQSLIPCCAFGRKYTVEKESGSRFKPAPEVT